MILSIEQIKALQEKATKGEWFWACRGRDFQGAELTGSGSAGILGVDHRQPTDENARFIAALPDITETALKALERVEELEKIVARHKELGIGENV